MYLSKVTKYPTFIRLALAGGLETHRENSQLSRSP